MNGSNNKSNWWDKPLRIAAVQCNYGEDSFGILDEFVSKSHFNTEQLLHITAKGHTAAYEEAIHGNILDDYLKEAHKKDIREIIYWNVHSTEDFYIKHPEWVQYDKNNVPYRIYSTHYLLCINSPWAEHFFTQLGKLCSHDIDGVFLDGPVFLADGCYCEYCQNRFKMIYNKDISIASYKDMLKFKVDSVTRFIKQSNKVIKEVNSNILLYINNSALRSDVTGSNTREVLPYVDMIGAEGGFAWTNRNSGTEHVTPMAKLLETQAEGKPYVIFTAGDRKPHSYHMHSAVDTKLMLAQSVATGAGIWYGIHAPTYVMQTPGGKEAVNFLNFLSKNEEYYENTVSVSKAAILWSVDSANYYSSDTRLTDFTESNIEKKTDERIGDHYRSFLGCYEMLMRSHMQIDVIDEHSIINRGILGKYTLLILPDCGCMSMEVVDKVKQYVENGGRLIATLDTGFYDQAGVKYEKPPLLEVFGIEKVNGYLTYTQSGTGYMNKTNDGMLDECFDADLMAAPDNVIDIKPSKQARIPVELFGPMSSRYEKLSEKRMPGVIYNKYFLGECIYIPSTIGKLFYNTGYPEIQKLFVSISDKLCDRYISTDAPRSLQMMLRKQEKRYILHLINTTGEMIKPTEKIIELNNIKIRINDRVVKKSIKCITSDIIADVFTKDDVTEVTLTKAGIYEVIVFEPESI